METGYPHVYYIRTQTHTGSRVSIVGLHIALYICISYTFYKGENYPNKQRNNRTVPHMETPRD